ALPTRQPTPHHDTRPCFGKAHPIDSDSRRPRHASDLHLHARAVRILIQRRALASHVAIVAPRDAVAPVQDRLLVVVDVPALALVRPEDAKDHVEAILVGPRPSRLT